jgi:hypothetical protein
MNTTKTFTFIERDFDKSFEQMREGHFRPCRDPRIDNKTMGDYLRDGAVIENCKINIGNEQVSFSYNVNDIPKKDYLRASNQRNKIRNNWY